MNIIEKIKEYNTERRLRKLRGDLLMIHKEFEYNPYNIGIPKYLAEAKQVSLELIENLTWGSGDGAAIRQFYRNNSNEFYEDFDQRKTYFAYTCPVTFRYVHTGLPKLISESMANLVFGNGYTFNTKVYTNETRTDVDIDKSAMLNRALYEIFDDNVMGEKLLQAATMESIAGDVAFKLSYDFELSYLPIVEVVDRRFYEVSQERGKIRKIKFKNYYEKLIDGTLHRYTFEEEYKHDENGYCYIENELKEIKNGKEIPVSLNAIEETAGLYGNEIINIGYYGDMAWHKKNKAYTGIQADYPYGSSDYGSKDNFDGADEAASGIISEIRENKTIRFWNEDLLKKDDNGNFQKINHYITNFVKDAKDVDQVQKDVKQQEFHDKTEQHVMKFNKMVEMACADCKISPISLGISGDISSASSDETLRERTAISRETATKKKELWTAFLNKMLPEWLSFAKFLTTLSTYPIGNKKAMAFKNLIKDIDLEMCELDTVIIPYDVKSIEDQLTTWGAANQSGVSSIENTVKQIYSGIMTDEEMAEEINRIKIEKNITLDNPDLLQLNDGEDNQ